MSFAEEVLDELLPADFDWRHMVRAYPLSSLAVASAGGFLLGRHRGLGLLSGLSTFVVREVGDNIGALLDGSRLGGTSPDDASYDDDAYDGYDDVAGA